MLWQPWTKKPHTEEDLLVTTRLVAGIVTTCEGWTYSQASEAFLEPARRIESLHRALVRSRHPSILAIMEHGLGLDYAVLIPCASVTLRCRKCSQSLCSFPCASCGIELQGSLWSNDEKTRCNRPRRPKRTGFLPGSPEKVEVMRQRAAMGQSIFSDKDK